METAAVFDLDGTLVDMPKKYWQADEFNWPNFINWMNEQKGLTSPIMLTNWHVANGHKLLIVTARPERYRSETVELLHSHDVCYNDELIMRTDEEVEVETLLLAECTTDEEIKTVLFKQHALYRERVALELKARGIHVAYAYDDQLDNLRVWKDVFGTSCWEVTPVGLVVGAMIKLI